MLIFFVVYWFNCFHVGVKYTKIIYLKICGKTIGIFQKLNNQAMEYFSSVSVEAWSSNAPEDKHFF